MDIFSVMQKARESLKGQWALAIGTMVVYQLVSIVPTLIPYIGDILGFLLTGPLMFGITKFAIQLSRRENPELEQIFDGFKNFGKNLLSYFLIILFFFLWSLLLVIPGLIALFSYSLTFYLLVEEPHLTPMEAIKKSSAMMNEYKWHLFTLFLWFLLLSLGCILTLGIGFFWLLPYLQISLARFYEEVKLNYQPEKQTGREHYYVPI